MRRQVQGSSVAALWLAALAWGAPAVQPPAAGDLAGLAQGAIVVRGADAIEYGHSAFRLIDGDTTYGWSSAIGTPTGQATVIELPERSHVQRVQFDTALAELDTHSPKQVTVEISDESAEAGFKPLASVTLAAQKDGQTFAADGTGRWLKLTVVSNYGADITEIGEFRAFGQQLTTTPLPEVTGTWESESVGRLHLQQNGTTVTGCYDGGLELIDGGLEGHVARFIYHTDTDRGAALMVFGRDGKTMFGGYWKISEDGPSPHLTVFETKKTSSQPGPCPQPSAPDQQMTQALSSQKRLRLYGINFDSDSDRIRDESKPTLELLARVLKAHSDWKLTVEGHTDSLSTAAHNQQLSEARAAAVKAWLVAAGIDGARLTTKGFGATQPVAPNDTQLGRAANRRVELTRD